MVAGRLGPIEVDIARLEGRFAARFLAVAGELADARQPCVNFRAVFFGLLLIGAVQHPGDRVNNIRDLNHARGVGFSAGKVLFESVLTLRGNSLEALLQFRPDERVDRLNGVSDGIEGMRLGIVVALFIPLFLLFPRRRLAQRDSVLALHLGMDAAVRERCQLRDLIELGQFVDRRPAARKFVHMCTKRALVADASQLASHAVVHLEAELDQRIVLILGQFFVRPAYPAGGLDDRFGPLAPRDVDLLGKEVDGAAVATVDSSSINLNILIHSVPRLAVRNKKNGW